MLFDRGANSIHFVGELGYGGENSVISGANFKGANLLRG